MAFITGLAMGYGFPGLGGAWVWIPAGLVLAVLSYKIWCRSGATFSPLTLCGLCGYLAIQPWLAPSFPENHVVHFVNSHPWRISGIVADTPLSKPRRTKLILKVTRLETEKESLSVFGQIRVTVYGTPPAFERGDALTFKGRIRAIRNFNNPGAFDYKTYLALKKIWGSAYTTADRLQVVRSTAKVGFFREIDRIRSRIANLIDGIETRLVSTDGKAVLKALIVGDRSGITPEWRMAFNRAGVGHLLAISGLHVGIIAATAFWLLRWLLSHWQAVLWRAWVNKGAAGLTLIPVVAYGLLAGLSPSTQRALIMVSVFLVAFLIEQEQDLFNTLAVAALIILIINPPALFSVSFQLSFAAVAAILVGLSFLKQGGRKPDMSFWRRIVRGLLSMGMVSLFAMLGTLPLVMHYFNLVSLVGWGANVLVVPLIGFTIIPLGLLAVGVYPLSATLALLLWQGCLVILSKVLDLIRIIADWPWAAARTVTPTGLEIACYYALLLGLFLLAKGRLAPHAANRAQLARWGKGVLVGVFLITSIDVGYWSYQRFGRSDLRVTAIDVGQGSATLVEMPGGHTVLIDGGGFGDNTVFDVGARVVAPFLWHKKIKTVETLVLSHPNSDHLNGLPFIAENFNTKEFWANGESADKTGYRKLSQVLKRTDIIVPNFETLPRSKVIGGVTLDILYPPRDFLQRRDVDAWRNSNNNSLVLKVSYGRRSVLIPGDIMARGEAELATLKRADLGSSVLLSPHHGSRTGSSALFLDQVDPQIVVISAGWQNRFGFPHPSVLSRYKNRGYQVFRTDQHGAVTIVTDGSNLVVTSLLQPT